MKNLLVITAEIPPTCAQGVRYINITKHLKRDFNITHITYDKKVLPLEGCTNISVIPFFEHLFPSIVIRAFRYISKKIFFPDEYIPKIILYKTIIRRIIRKNKFEVIIVCMTPFSFLKLGAFIKKLDRDVNLIADFSDPFSANAIYTNNAKKQNKARAIETKYAGNFNTYIVLNNKIRDYYKALNFNNVTTVEQGVDELFSQFSPLPLLNEKMTLIYAGGFYKGFRDPSVLLTTIKESNLDINFIIFGGPNRNKFNLDDYKFVRRYKHVPHSQLILKYTVAHVLVIIDNFYGIQVPGKTIECLAFNRPVLFIYENFDSPTLLYLKDTSGVYISRNRADEIISVLERIWREYGHTEKSFNVTPYSWINLSQKFKLVINK